MTERIFIEKTPDYEGKDVKICGWVHSRRNHGKIIFIDLRDRSGIIQVVFTPQNEEIYKLADSLRSEWVIAIEGKINIRPKGMQNATIKTGSIEMQAEKLEVLNPAETPPFAIDDDGRNINEEIRMKYRYLDLRRSRMQKNIRMRDKVISFFREYMHKNDFVEIETPILMKGTPEGSREYVVPSRLEKGKFYVLPQSPQQFKQLSMVAGFEKYFQIARCFRDEDTRGDRQPEFTQLDYEMSFVTQEDVLQFTEKMFIELVKTLYPDKKITETPFPRVSYKESIEKYGNDKPDIRKNKNDPDELGFIWIVDFPMFSKDNSGKIQAEHHPFCSIKDEDMEKFMQGKDVFSLRANSYDLVLNSYELSSGSIRIHKSEVQQKVFELLNISKEEQKARFGHMIEAFKYGAPPHGGFAPGIDRIMMLLENEPNIREVIAFPKTGDGRDLMMDAPSELGSAQLKELGLSIEKKQIKIQKSKVLKYGLSD